MLNSGTVNWAITCVTVAFIALVAALWSLFWFRLRVARQGPPRQPAAKKPPGPPPGGYVLIDGSSGATAGWSVPADADTKPVRSVPA